jgi:RNA polymerase sigma factor (sigma-70 family)
MPEDRTTMVIHRYLDELAGKGGDSSAEPVVAELLTRAVERLHILCAALLHRDYPRLAKPPLNLQSDEMLGAVVIRLLKALRKVHPQNPRQFFALANQHMRWELNDLARRLDNQTAAVALREDQIAEPPSRGSEWTPNASRILEAIERLPDVEREVFDLVRIQGMPQTEAAEILGVSAKTVQRRLNRGVLLLSEKLADLKPTDAFKKNP